MKLETLLIHSGAEVDSETGAVAPPIHLSTTYEHSPDGELVHGYEYVRDANPTQSRLETALAAIEGGEKALVFASGLAAGACFLQILPAGSHVIAPSDVYHGFREIFLEYLPRWGQTWTEVDMTDLDAVRRAMTPQTRLLWAESPSNPLLQVVDLAALSEIAHAGGAEMLVDSTFATPILQRPIEFGVDVVLHSSTKYMGGHSDVQGGVLVLAKHEPHGAKLDQARKILGNVASPMNSWLVLRGLRSLDCRVRRHAENAMAVAEALERHPAVEKVHYPGLTSDAGHKIARRQMRAFGGMVSLRVRGGREAALSVASRVQLFVNATSLGGVESLIEHRASIEGPHSSTPANLLRLSVGLEHADDLIADLYQALDGKRNRENPDHWDPQGLEQA